MQPKKKQVLVVDDSSYNLFVMESILTGSNSGLSECEVTTALNG